MDNYDIELDPIECPHCGRETYPVIDDNIIYCSDCDEYIKEI